MCGLVLRAAGSSSSGAPAALCISLCSQALHVAVLALHVWDDCGSLGGSDVPVPRQLGILYAVGDFTIFVGGGGQW